MNNNNILIVEDDEITALNLNISLKKQNYNVVAIYDNISQAKDYLDNNTPDIVIIDISLQESSDGIELAKTIRSTYHIPFIYLTSYSDDDIIAQAKLTEPYGYIVKPFEPGSLHATIQMALFKFEAEKTRKENSKNSSLNTNTLEQLLLDKRVDNESIVRFGDDYHIDISVYETFYKNNKIRLTKKENSFLRLLVAKLGLVVGFEEAMGYVWEENGASENSVRTLVWRLRNKLETDIIKNASGIGYFIEE